MTKWRLSIALQALPRQVQLLRLAAIAQWFWRQAQSLQSVAGVQTDGFVRFCTETLADSHGV